MSMLNVITKGYVWTKVNADAFIKNNRGGGLVEYIMIIALAGILIAAVKTPLIDMVKELMNNAKNSVTPSP